MAYTTEDQIKQVYDAQLKSKNEQLSNQYDTAALNLDEQKKQNQQAADTNLNKIAAQSQKAAMADAEYYAAAGLTSGAKAQARLARENQMLSDMATVRAAQQAADAEVERQRGLLAKKYDSAIRQAQADNDMALAQALYKQAKSDEERLLKQQQDAAKLMAGAGDYTLYGQLYGLTPEQIATLNGKPVVPKGYLTPEQVEELLVKLLAKKGTTTNGTPNGVPASVVNQAVASPNQTVMNNSGIFNRDLNVSTKAV